MILRDLFILLAIAIFLGCVAVALCGYLIASREAAWIIRDALTKLIERITNH
jgi:hypothetical protein